VKSSLRPFGILYIDCDYIGEVRIEERVGDVLPASSPAPDDQDEEEEHNDDTELDRMHTAYESFVANMNASGSAMPYAEGPGLHARTSSYSGEISMYSPCLSAFAVIDSIYDSRFLLFSLLL
jgi:hypothetical protein